MFTDWSLNTYMSNFDAIVTFHFIHYRLHIREKNLIGQKIKTKLTLNKQERKWRVGREGNCPPSIWQNT